MKIRPERRRTEMDGSPGMGMSDGEPSSGDKLA
jgi:hypothetical protein